MDAEGAELGIFKGARRLLKSPKPPLILCEVSDSRTKPWGYRADSSIEFLEDHGYRWYGLDGDGQLIPHPEGLSGNFVAMPDSKPWLR